jgi:AraC-like DNA-binding protein
VDLIDDLLAGRGWARFDPELGYVLGDSAIDWGLDGTRTIETFDDDGARAATHYPGVRARINCYGDAFTEGTQVSDGETWEEYLAAHLGEPVGNYGVGVYGLYQAYRRMRRVESRRTSQVVVLYVLPGNVMLSATRSAWYSVSAGWRTYARERGAFHGTLWPNIELDLDSGRLVERENPLRTPESLYRLCEPDWLADALGDDIAGQLVGYVQGFFERPEMAVARRLADVLETRFDDRADTAAEFSRLLTLYTRRTAIAALDLAKAFTEARGSRLLVVMDLGRQRDASLDPDRSNDPLLLHALEHDFSVFDMSRHHRAALQRTNLTSAEYMAELLAPNVPPPVAHPNAHGNHIFAYAIKDSVLALLDTKPAPYDSSRSPSRLRATLGSAAVGDSGHSVEAVLQEMRSRFAEQWTASSLARLARSSRSSFYAHFVEVMKMTPMEYLKVVRLDEGARLLRETDDLVASIATRVGFASPSHFTREFVRRFGVSPSVFRAARS